MNMWTFKGAVYTYGLVEKRPEYTPTNAIHLMARLECFHRKKWKL